MNWDQYFAGLAFFVAMKSKDKHTRIGSVVVDSSHNIISTGYNDFPCGIKNKIERFEKPLKYLHVVHSELNAICQASKRGISLNNCILYTTGYFPCTECSKAIIQSGIKEVVVCRSDLYEMNDFWKNGIAISKEMLSESGVAFREFNGSFPTEIKGLNNGNEIKFQ